MINFNKKYKVHFIGIGGVSMHSLALFCHNLGWTVTGSDASENKYTDICKRKGIMIKIGHQKSNIKSIDFVVASSAIKAENEEIQQAIELGVPIYDRAEFLTQILHCFTNVIAISGSHGKSTTSTMIYEILRRAKKRVSCHIGADVDNESFKIFDDILVLEACEYNKSFLKFKVDTAIVLNVEKDHLECYGSFYQLKNAFLSFLKHAKKRYVFSSSTTDYIKLKDLIRIEQPKILKNKFIFMKHKYTLDYLVGKHYIYDACVAIKVATDLGVSYKIIYETLRDFRPINRRQQLIANVGNSEIYIDYAHHPTEIKCNLDAFSRYKTLCVFQPHTFSRTKFLKKEFVNVLSSCDTIILKEYSARETEKDGLSAYELYREIKKKNANVKYADNEEELKNILNEMNCLIDKKQKSSTQKSQYERIVFFGAGNIDKVAYNIYSH